MICFRAIVDKEFMEKCIPDVMMAKAIKMLSNKDVINMDTYLQETYNTSLKNIIQQVYENFETNTVDNLVVFKIKSHLLEKRSQQDLSALIRLIDYGNTNIKGVKFTQKLVQYINDNIKEMYSIYLKHNQKEKDEKGE